MNKVTKIIIAIVAVVAIIAVAVIVSANFLSFNENTKTNLEPITSVEDLEALVAKVYEGLTIEMPMVMTQVVDVTDNDAVKYVTGLENADDLEYVVESAAMMGQPYSLVLAKVKEGVNIEEVAKEMNEKIDNRKWICVTADKVYTTTSGDVICLVMANEETAKAVYSNFKALAGTVGEEYERTAEEIELPDDMLPAYDGEELPEEETESEKDLFKATSAEDLTALVDKIYEGLTIEMPMLMSQTVDITDTDAVNYVTGLENADDVEYIVESAPMMTSQAYSLVLVKVKDGANVEKVAKEMNEKIDARKWICVTAEKVYTTSSENVVCLVMSNEQTAKAIYENFKTLAGTVGEEYARTVEDGELPADMIP